MRKYLALIFITIFAIGCSSMGETNRIVKEDISFVGGAYGDGKWDDKLTFKRTSWFQKAQMSADIMLAKIDDSSPFSNWLGESGKLNLKNCSQFYVALLYRNSFRTLSRVHLSGAIVKAGFREISIPRFKENIQAHLTTNEMNFEQHKVTGFCASTTTAEIDSIYASIPGFERVNLL